MQDTTTLSRLFRYKAEQVSTIVTEAATAEDAIGYAVGICNQKQACSILPSGCEHDLSEGAQSLCHDKPAKLIAAPDLSRHHWDLLVEDCDNAGIGTIRHGLRSHLGGIDIGISWAQYGIAETGTLVIDSTDEDLRLATMVSEIHIAFLPLSGIVESAADLTGRLQTQMNSDGQIMAVAAHLRLKLVGEIGGTLNDPAERQKGDVDFAHHGRQAQIFVG